MTMQTVECPKSGGGEHEEDYDLGICHWCDAPMSDNFITREQWGEEHGYSVTERTDARLEDS